MQIFEPLHPIRQKRLSWYVKSLKPTAYYPLGEVGGAIAYNHAPSTLKTLNGAITSVSLGESGQVGKAFSFNGTSGKVVISANSVLDTSNFSVAFLYNKGSSQPTSFRSVLLKQLVSGSLGQWGFLPHSDGSMYFFIKNNAGTEKNTYGSTTILPTSTWRFYVFTYNGTTLIPYENGLPKTSVAGGYDPQNSNVTMMWREENNSFCSGLLQHLIIFNKVITPNQIFNMAKIIKLA